MSSVETKVKPAGHGMALFMVVFLTAALTLGVWQHRPPRPVSKLAAPETFSSERAIEHTRLFATKPHPIGSEANAAVAAYIQKAVATMGLTTEIQEAVNHHVPGHLTRVHNILARIPGSASTGALLLCGHYDSVAFGPGASDDGSGVSTLLETMRALRSGPPLKNDVIFLFSDGEEGRANNGTGLSGARAFAEQHPWAKDVIVAINFDARGTRGVSYMYETSPGNGWLIQQLAQADCHPIATSLMGDIYHALPFASDFTAFLDTGMAGYNCAFVEGFRMYHTALDTPEHASLASLQQDGDYALGLTRRLGGLSLQNVRAPDVVYFNTLGYHLVYYPKTWAVPIAGIACGVYALALLIGLLRRRITLRGVLRSAFFYLAFICLMLVLSAAAVAYGFWSRWAYILYTENWLTLALLGLALCTTYTNLPWTARRFGVANLATGTLLLWALLSAASAFLSPGASYLTAWPLLASSLGLLLCFLRKDPARVSKTYVAFLMLTALPGIVLITSAATGLHACVTVLLAPLVVVMGLLLLGLLVPHLHLACPRYGWVLSIVLGILTGFCFLKASMTGTFSATYPKLDSLTYGLDATTGQAFWLSCDPRPDLWVEPHIPTKTDKKQIKEFFPDTDRTHLKADAPILALAPPTLTLTSDNTAQGVRTLHFHVASARGANLMELYAAEETSVLSAVVDGQALKALTGRWFLKYLAFPPQGIELMLEVNANTPVILRAVDHSYGLPELPEAKVGPRPPELIPKPNTVDANKDPLKTDETLVSRVYVF